MLQNLLDNAVKYTDAGRLVLSAGLDPAASASVDGDGPVLLFTVTDTDTGCGIAEADQGRRHLVRDWVPVRADGDGRRPLLGPAASEQSPSGQGASGEASQRIVMLLRRPEGLLPLPFDPAGLDADATRRLQGLLDDCLRGWARPGPPHYNKRHL